MTKRYDPEAAILAAAPRASFKMLGGFEAAVPKLQDLGAFDSAYRLAHLIGQCAHESQGFTRLVENLYYTSGRRLRRVWPTRRRFWTNPSAYVRNPEALSNYVYANRMGNGNAASGDGYRYRGRGIIHLTGKSNYRSYSEVAAVNLVAEPERAEDPDIAWIIAAAYFARRRRKGRTLFEWADLGNVEQVTRGVNGGTHGLEDRRLKTSRALAALNPQSLRPVLRRGSRDEAGVLALQQMLAEAGFPAGALDGDFGPRTERAVLDFQTDKGLASDGIVGPATRSKLIDAVM